MPPPNQLVAAGVSDAGDDPTLSAWQNAQQYGQPVSLEVDSRVPQKIRDKIPIPGKCCYDLPGNALNLPPGGENGRSREDLVRGVRSKGYNTQVISPGETLPPVNSLPDDTVVIIGNSHAAVVKGGRLVDYTKPAPTMGVPARVNVRDSLEDLRNAKSKRTRNGQEEYAQPYKNAPIEIHTPPKAGSGSAPRPTSPPPGALK